MNDENWSRPEGAGLEENIAALRRMRVIVWVFLALLGGTLCFLAGLMAGGSI